jgi:O-antigen ligase
MSGMGIPRTDNQVAVRHLAVLRLPAYELPFWILLVVLAFMPGRFTLWVDVAGVPMNHRYFLVIPVAVFYLLMWWPPRPTQSLWHYNLPGLTLGLLLYSAISMLWSGMSQRDIAPMGYVVVMNILVFTLGYTLVARRSSVGVGAFLRRLTLFLAAVGLVYSADRFFNLGFSQLPWYLSEAFGIPRVSGPLYGASQVHIIMLPALGFAVNQVIVVRSHRWLYLGAAFALVIAIMGSGSRAAYLILFIFAVLTVFSVQNKRQRTWIIGAMLSMLVLGMVIVFAKATPERLMHMEDMARGATHLTAWNIWMNAPFEKKLFGSGHGAWWPWYLNSTIPGGVENAGLAYVTTPYGITLFHPHSVLLLLGVELGLVGLAYLGILWFVLGRLLLESFAGRTYAIFGCSIFAASFAMFVDLVLFRGALPGTITYWTFFFGLLLLRRNTRTAPGSQSDTHVPA